MAPGIVIMDLDQEPIPGLIMDPWADSVCIYQLVLKPHSKGCPYEIYVTSLRLIPINACHVTTNAVEVKWAMAARRKTKIKMIVLTLFPSGWVLVHKHSGGWWRSWWHDQNLCVSILKAVLSMTAEASAWAMAANGKTKHHTSTTKVSFSIKIIRLGQCMIAITMV